LAPRIENAGFSTTKARFPVRTIAIPEIAKEVPSVVIKGFTFANVTRAPFIEPKNIPIRIAALKAINGV
jgi:hypothetical protein